MIEIIYNGKLCTFDDLPSESTSWIGCIMSAIGRNSAKFGYIYVLGNHIVGSYKIGRTTTPKNRTSLLGVLAPFPVELMHLFTCSGEEASEIESALHNKFADKRTNGEWFNLTSDDLKWFNNRFAKLIHNEHTIE